MSRRWWVCVCVATMGLAHSALGQATFQGIGLFPSEGASFTSPNGISPDGLVVVGQALADSIDNGGFRWTAETGLECLGALPDGTGGEGLDVNADGSVIVGKGWSPESTPNTEAYRWTAEGGMIGLGDLPGGFFQSVSEGVPGDGTIVVGTAFTDVGLEGFRWTEETGMVGLGALGGKEGESTARAISADGQVIVGSSGYPYRWTEEEGMVSLSGNEGRPEDVTADGSVIVGGLIYSPMGGEAFRWTEETGLVGLGGFPDGPLDSWALGVSADGSIVVGFACTAIDFIFCEDLEPFIWDAQHGLRNFTAVLTEGYGLDLGGWELTGATDISADGLTIVGAGGNPQNQFEGWIVRLPDCNGNGIADDLDILDGIVIDNNGNFIPDECEEDCNGNKQDDLEDIADGTSDDCNNNHIPDECEPDCNDNDQLDACDIASGISQDCGGEGIPDECPENPGPPITQQPVAQEVEVGGFAFFQIEADGVLLEFQWRKDGVDLQDDGRIIGSESPTLFILDVVPGDAGSYGCLVMEFLGACALSNPAVLTVLDTCLADFNSDGVVGPRDLTTVLRDWGPCPDPDACPADLNADGLVGPIDLAQLLGAWGPC